MNENEINQMPEEEVLQPEVEAPVEQAEEETVQPEKKQKGDRRSPMEIIIAVTAVVLIVAMMAAMIMGGLNGDTTQLDNTAATVPADGNLTDATCKGTYTVSDEEAKTQSATVVATIGDKALTNADLQIYYWMQVNSFLNEYGSYASVFGLDYTQPLDTQACMLAEGMTWQQYFLAGALESWTSYESLALEAIAAEFDKKSEDYQTYAASVREQIRAEAESLGYASMEEAIADIVGVGTTEDAYVNYMQTSYLGYLYYSTLASQRLPATDAQIEAYFEENAAEYAESGLTKETGKYIDIRHILVMPEGGTTGEDGTTTYSEEEWETARVEAQDILDQWLAGDATEEEFAELANSYSDDSDGTDGGLYTDVYQGQMVEEFDAWCFDESRVVGDYGLVKTQYGYHVMYFSGSTPIWYATAKSDLETEISNNIIPEITEKYEISMDYTKMALSLVELS